jgi:flagella synthesis protein FlgN
MNTNNFKQILESDLEFTNSLIQLLEQEKQILTDREIDNLPPLIEKKQHVMEQMEENFQKRIAFLQDTVGKGSYVEQLNTFLNELSPQENQQFTDLNQKLEEGIGRCRDLNQINGQVIAVNMHNREQLLNLIQGKSQQTTYDATGAVKHQQQQKDHREV